MGSAPRHDRTRSAAPVVPRRHAARDNMARLGALALHVTTTVLMIPLYGHVESRTLQPRSTDQSRLDGPF
ncbi:hypothetical protein J6590_025905 [Homalodisca vitripennis]|nr:hypothetical protein J6590_025905 [Homalodisca vitripennis]